LNSSDNHVKQIVENFNAERFHSNDIDENSVYIKSGFGPATLQKINIEVKQKFPEKTFEPI
jgi:hypothetical protein